MRVALKPSTLLTCLVLGGFQLFAQPCSGHSLSRIRRNSTRVRFSRNLDPDTQESLMNRFGDRGRTRTIRAPVSSQCSGRGADVERFRPPKSDAQRKHELERAREENPVFRSSGLRTGSSLSSTIFLPPRPISLETLASLGAAATGVQNLQSLAAGSSAAAALSAGAGSPAGAALTPGAAAALAPGAAAVPGAGFAPGAAGVGLNGNGPLYSISGRKLTDEDRKQLQDLIDLILTQPYPACHATEHSPSRALRPFSCWDLLMIRRRCD